jgi:TPR repeat protein
MSEITRSKRESGRLLIIVSVLIALSAGAVYWKRTLEAPEEAYQAGLAAYAKRAHAQAAIAWKEADALGHPEASYRLAGLYLEGHGVEKNHKRAFELLEKAAEAGRGPAQLELARLYERGRGTPKDMEKAVLWYWSAAKNEIPEAQLEVGRLYHEGRGVDVDLEEASRWYGLAAEAGLGEAQLALALMYHNGDGVEEDPESAAFWLREAAEGARLPEAWFLLGEYHEMARGGFTKDLDQAAWCYEQAGEEDHREALYRAGHLARIGRGSKKGPDAAANYFARAASLGHKDAMYEIGRAFELGEGTRRSRNKAEEWYGKAAALGQVEAMAALQDMDLNSRKLSRSEKRRLEKKRRAEREKRESEQARKMMQVGRCEVYASGSPVIEMRTRMDCLNRGGSFQASSQDEQGSFSTVDDGPGWNTQRRQLNQRRRAEARRSREAGYGSGSSSVDPLPTDWVVCYSRSSRDSDGRGQNSCSSAMPKTQDRTTSWCRGRGYDSRRLFKHESSARSWRSKNCR